MNAPTAAPPPAKALRPLDDVLAELLSHARPLNGAAWPDEQVSTFEADGRVLTESVVSPLQVPPHDNSAMDGYALRAADAATAGAVLPVSQRIAAGEVPTPLQPGTAARIFTGAPVPPGADTVVMQEDCEDLADAQGAPQVRFVKPVRAGMAIRRSGEDVQLGSVVLAGGPAPPRGVVLDRRRTGHARRCAARAFAGRRHLQLQPILFARAAAAHGLRGHRLRHRARQAGAHPSDPGRGGPGARPHPHQRWRQRGRGRPRQAGRAVAGRAAPVAAGHQARQALCLWAGRAKPLCRAAGQPRVQLCHLPDAGAPLFAAPARRAGRAPQDGGPAGPFHLGQGRQTPRVPARLAQPAGRAGSVPPPGLWRADLGRLGRWPGRQPGGYHHRSGRSGGLCVFHGAAVMSAEFELRVRYFASIREALGRGDETVRTRATTLGELRDELIARGGAYAEVLARQRPVRLALNQDLRDESAALAAGAEVAFFPPVTGG